MARTGTHTGADMLYSPEQQIPIGVPVFMEDGRPALEMKYKTKRNNTKTEIVPLDFIISGTVNSAASRHLQNSQEPRLNNGADR